jgi:hypothetical protein
MRNFIIIASSVLAFFVLPNDCYSQPSISDLLDGDPNFPLKTQDNYYIFTKDQTNLMITYLEDRIDLKLRINELREDLEKQELLNLDQNELAKRDRIIIQSLTDINKLKETETIGKLNVVDYNVKEIKDFVLEEKERLKRQNTLFKVGGGVMTVIAGILTYSLITR